MQDPASELPRITIPRTPVNKGISSLSAPLSAAVSSKAKKVRVSLHQPPVVLLGALEELAPLAPKAATNVPSWRRKIIMSGSDSSM
jgi:hypothetical protein